MANQPTSVGLGAPSPDLPRAFGTLELLKLLARGQRGDVYAALQPEGVDRYRAVKILHGSADTNAALVTALQGEATRLVRAIHGNVVQIYDVGKAGDRLFFVGELVDGRDLGALLAGLAARGERLAPELAVFIAVEVAAAISYVRRATEPSATEAAVPIGLAPQSVLLSADGDVKLLHYGTTLAAAVAARPGRDPSSERTPFIAPELAAAGGASAAGDVYAVGALLWHMLTGVPLGGDNPAGHLAALRAGSFTPRAPSSAGAKVPEALDRLVLAALARTPALRPKDCDDLRRSLAPLGKSLGGSGSAGLAALLTRMFGEALAADRVSLGEQSRVAEARRAEREASTTPGPITLARLDIVAKQRIATPIGGDLPPGQPIPGTRYRTISKIGEGGMGVVYAAEHVDLEKKVALKLLNAEMLRSPEVLQQFRQEARAASKIGNPYICDVTDFGEVLDGRVFFVMQYLDGQTLGRVLRREARLAPARAIALLRQIAKALGAAHEKGIVHLDVKPDNVMLIEREGRPDAVKVVDFGIAGLLGQRGNEENLAGTAEYIAPERALGRGYDHRSDVYSLGALAYEMLAGEVPFHGTTVMATMTMQAKDPAEPIRKRVPDANVPAALEAVVLKMLEKDPAARQQSMAELEAELCEAQIAAGLRTSWDDLPLPAVDEQRRAKLADGMPSPTGRPKKAIVYAAVAVAAIAAGIAVYFGVIKDPEVRVEKVIHTVTKTPEEPSVIPLLDKAAAAWRAQRFVKPPGDSALDHIVSAEEEATRLKAQSPGARSLRTTYATALATMGDQFLDADLQELAISRWKEALLFTPDDPALQAKARLTAEEKKATERLARTGSARASVEKAAAPGVEAREAAGRLYLAAREGRFSEARLALRPLRDLDAGGAQAARIADSLRKLAVGQWTAGKFDASRPFYELIAELDPGDAEARARARPGARPEAEPSPSPTPSPSPGGPKAKKPRDVAQGEDMSDAPRDPAASQKAAQAGVAALARGRLSEAEEAFARAVRADPTNPVGVGGMAEVAFERAKYAEAMDYARRAARLAPRAHKYFIIMGDAYFKLLRYADALAAYQKASGLAPGDASLKIRLERVNEKLGRK